MHLLHIVHRYWPCFGGSETYFREVSERLAREGHRVTVLTTNAWDIEYFLFPDRKHLAPSIEEHSGVRIERYPIRHFPWRHLPIMQALAKLPTSWSKPLFLPSSPLIPGLWRRLILLGGVSAVHASPSPFYSLIYPAWQYAKWHRIPFIFTPFIHTGEPGSDDHLKMHTMPFQIALMKEADRIIVQTKIEGKALEERGITPDTIRLLGMGVDQEEIHGGQGISFRKKYGIQQGEGLAIHVGSLNFDKGSSHAVLALRSLLEKGEKLRLVLAGIPSSEFRRFLEGQPEAIRKACILIEHVAGQEKRDLFDAADLLLMPTRADTYGIVFLEAWLAGKPVIGAYAGGVPEVIENGRDGFLVPFGDVHMLSKHIELLLRNKELAHSMGQKGRQKALKCSWENRYKTFQDILSGLSL